MAFFTQETLTEKNNTLMIVCVIILLIFSVFVLNIRDDLLGILISLILLMIVALIVVVFME